MSELTGGDAKYWLSRVLTLASVSPALTVGSANPRAAESVGRIVGHIDGISRGGQFFLSGWACQLGRKESIDIHIYAAPPNTPDKRNFVTANHANFDSESAVNQACHDAANGKHRFLVALPSEYTERNLYDVHGIRVVAGVPNDAIGGSGKPLHDLGVPSMPVRSATVPSLSGAYVSSAIHPRVFTTPADLKDVVTRINRSGSYSARRFSQLAGQVAHDLASRRDWDATYSGCFVSPYLYTFSYEPQDGHDAETHGTSTVGAGHALSIRAPAAACRLPASFPSRFRASSGAGIRLSGPSAR
jgi:hypothetical protein